MGHPITDRPFAVPGIRVPRPAWLSAGLARAPQATALGIARFRAAASGTPFTTAFLAVLLATTVFMRTAVDDPNGILRWVSTNVDNLTDRPVVSMVSSALFLPDEVWLPYAVALALALVPLERRFGSLRALLVFASGHVLATIATEIPVALLIARGSLSADSSSWLDVGVSYGMYTSLVAASVLLPLRGRLVAVGVLGFSVLSALMESQDMTAIGHVTSALIGLAWWPVLLAWSRRPAVGPDFGGSAVLQTEAEISS